ncbi:MAG: nuclear transport factor 2 family protein [Chitinophagaceae bacterium]
MKTFFTILFFLVCSITHAQTSFLKDAVSKLDKALVSKDTIILKQLLHKDVSYGHSNAWIETKIDIIKNLYNGKISYSTIGNRDFTWTMSKDWAKVRSTADIEYTLDGKDGKLKLHVLQVWLKTNKGWQLLARQSTKIEDKTLNTP